MIEKDVLAIPDAGWKEIFNSDAAIYRRPERRQFGRHYLLPTKAVSTVVIPANGFVVFVKQ